MVTSAPIVFPPPPLGEGRGGGLHACPACKRVSLHAPTPTLPQRGREFENGGR